MSTTDFAYKIELIGRNDPSLVKTWIDVVQNQGDVRQVATALASNTRLRVLRLHFWPATADHTTDEQAAQELASVIAKSKLEGLVIAWKEFRQSSSSSSFQYYEAILAKCLLEAVQKSLTIRDLNLLHGIGCMTSLIECLPKLRKLCIVGSSTTPERLLHPLFQSLCQSATLTTLAIQGIQLNEQDMKALSKGLGGAHSSVTKLLLDQCGICDNGVEAFLQYWHLQSPIRHLEWTNNLICAMGATMLLKSASNRNAMESLNLSGNEKIGYEGLVCVALEIPNMFLKELNVASCVPPQQPCKSDTDSDTSSEVSQLLSQLVLQGLAANTQLLELNVLCNGIDTVTPTFQREYQLYTFRNRLFQWMTMSSSSSLLPFGIWGHIFAKYTHNPSCILLFLKEQPVLILQAVAPHRGEEEDEEDEDGHEDDWVLL